MPDPDDAGDTGRHWVAAFDGRRLAAHRQAHGWSQVELAEQLQRERAGDAPVPLAEAARAIRTLVVQVSCYESGRTRPRAAAIRALAAALGLDVLDLLAEGTATTLAILRARLGFTQGQVAQRLGVSRSWYAAVEQGARDLDQAAIVALAGVLQVPAERIRGALAERRP